MKDGIFRGISHVRLVVSLPSQEPRETFFASTACYMCFDDVPFVLR